MANNQKALIYVAGSRETSGTSLSVKVILENIWKLLEIWHTFVTGGGEAGLTVGLEVAGDVGGTQHLPANVAGDFAFMPYHVWTQTVFGGEGGRAGLQWRKDKSLCGQSATDQWNSLIVQESEGQSYRYLAFKGSFCGVYVLDMTAKMIRPVERKSHTIKITSLYMDENKTWTELHNDTIIRAAQ